MCSSIKQGIKKSKKNQQWY